jgi:hypothetical protein
MLSYRKSPFQERMILMEFAHGVLNIQGRVLNTLTVPRQDSPGNYRDSNVQVPVAGENKDGIDGHRHGLPLLEGGYL